MRLAACIVLFALLLTAFLPQSVPSLILLGGEQTIGDLDLCHAAAPALSGNGEMPFLNECRCSPVPTMLLSFSPVSHAFFSQIIFTIRNERPPIA